MEPTVLLIVARCLHAFKHRKEAGDPDIQAAFANLKQEHLQEFVSEAQVLLANGLGQAFREVAVQQAMIEAYPKAEDGAAGPGEQGGVPGPAGDGANPIPTAIIEPEE